MRRLQPYWLHMLHQSFASMALLTGSMSSIGRAAVDISAHVRAACPADCTWEAALQAITSCLSRLTSQVGFVHPGRCVQHLLSPKGLASARSRLGQSPSRPESPQQARSCSTDADVALCTSCAHDFVSPNGHLFRPRAPCRRLTTQAHHHLGSFTLQLSATFRPWRLRCSLG